MSDVSILGLGDMGSAIGHALLTAGKAVTVWNRSPQRSVALGQAGAAIANSAREAVAASPMTLICLSDYPTTLALLESAGEPSFLKGRLIVQLTSGTPAQARALDSWMRQRGARYLAGAIGAWPRQVGTTEAAFTMSGPEADFAAASGLLHLLAGSVTHTGTDIGHAAAYANAGLAYFAAHWIGFAQGAAIAQAEGLDPAVLGEMLSGMAPLLAQDLERMGRAIAVDAFADAESTVKTVAGDLRWLAELAGESKADDRFPQLAAELFASARDRGLGAEQHTAVFKVIRHPAAQ